ncbi:heme NO-binding domain-containing protein [Pseudosulfitobacter koreensis]|uniref:Heme NO-binding domain-containing protein n=1 Tax=Pseudosulfitobacter koreensis TaxID=2968472 RepID=A0ABT1Z4U8_9RHOB|nr:heme NO-binding domain-containing protein [Pseudosulfitobacter koreense]MCR8828150.1 heme NO-binding domain-containing protein [Pseudosulfitobacter koreense]
MHGLIYRALQCFVTDSYGPDRWIEVAMVADLGLVEFEAMLMYDDAIAPRLIAAVGAVLGRSEPDLMEDVGTYLVSHPNTEGLRRLMRFGGVTFVELLHSLDDLPDRARLAVSDLNLPHIELREYSSSHFSVICGTSIPRFGHVMMGLLRTMADDYGALALLEFQGGAKGTETVSITLVETEFAKGRSFALGARAS